MERKAASSLIFFLMEDNRNVLLLPLVEIGSSALAARSVGAPMRLPAARLVFPGGGIFFWWQAGAITSLSKRIDLSAVPCCGASAGSAEPLAPPRVPNGPGGLCFLMTCA